MKRTLGRPRYGEILLTLALSWQLVATTAVFGQTPPVLNSVFPAGGRAGQAVELTVSGGNLQTLRTLQCDRPGVRCEKVDASRFRLTIPADSPPGLCDVWAVGDNGVSAPRTFVISARTEVLETEPNEAATAMSVPLDAVVNGRLDKAGDSDHFRFEARRGQRVVVDCLAERIDSRLRAVLEIFDSTGRRLAVNRGYFGIDPLLDFIAPADGVYVVKLQDLTSSGGGEHYYRLDIDTGPRVAFAVPAVIPRGQAARVTLVGWNLGQRGPASPANGALERLDVEIPATLAEPTWPLSQRLQPAQVAFADMSFPFHLPGSQTPVIIGLSDVPVLLDREDNHSAAAAQEIAVPSEVSGSLAARDERDWFSISARRGEVFFIEALGQRLSSPVDLQVSVFDASGLQELAHFTDEVRSIGLAFPTSHLDPVGRWVCPRDGRYLILLRNLVGGAEVDPRRTYRLSVRREEPDFRLLAVPRREDQAGLNVRRNGRELLDVFAFRRRGFDGAIRVTAKDLPPGVESPDVWIGPGVERATVVVSADRSSVTTATVGELKLEGIAEHSGLSLRHAVRGATIVRSGTPVGWGRLTSQIPLAVSGEAPLRITADAHEPIEHHLYGKLPAKHAPGGVLDVAVEIERSDAGHQAPVKLIGVGLPESIRNQTAVIPAGQWKGYLSFYLPPTMPVGRYSLTVRAETTVPSGNKKPEPVSVVSNSINFEVQPAAFLVEVDPFAVTQAKRGETIQVPYTAKRLNGFIGKMHTELASPGKVTDVVGLRGRGETFTGQTEKGTLQIVINDDAPLGRQSFLRFFTVGVVEDEATFFGSSFLPLEIVE